MHNYNIRKAVYRNEACTLIDVELDHPEFGTIPYTYDSTSAPESLDEYVIDVLDQLTVAPYIPYTPSQAEQDRQLVLAAKNYLDSTDWVVTKIAEAQVLNEDLPSLIEKYVDILAERKSARATINNLETQLSEGETHVN